MEGMETDPFNSRIPPRPTWFHKDPEIALSELGESTEIVIVK